MDTIIKTILSIFVFAFITYLGVGVINAQVDSSAANSFMEDAKSEIADANFSPAVIEAVKSQAKENDYELTVTTYQKGKEEEGGTGTEEVSSVGLVMTYHYDIPILGVKNEHKIRGFVN